MVNSEQLPAKWQTLEESLMLDCPVFQVYRRFCQHPHRLTQHPFYVINGLNAVHVVPVTTDNKIILVRQYRFGCEQLLWELPAGFLEKDEEPIACGIRELLEETGYVGKEARLLGSAYVSPSTNTSKAFFVHMHSCIWQQATNWDEHEEIEIKIVEIAQVKEMIRSGTICCGSSMMALLLFFQSL
jgi:ADP-ribose pyrophosphatase